MKSVLSLIFVFSLFGFSSFGYTTQFSDPKNIMETLNGFIGSKNFQTDLACHSEVNYFAPVVQAELACSPDGCYSFYQTNSILQTMGIVDDCTGEGVNINFDNGRVWEVSKANFDSHKGNMAWLFLETLSDFIGYDGNVVVTGMTPTTYTLSDGTIIDAMNLTLDFSLPNHVGTPFQGLVTVLKTSTAIGQIARFRLGTQTWIRLENFSKTK